MKKTCKFLIICLIVLALSGAVLWIIGLGVTPSVSYVKSQMYELYNLEGIDTVFVGPSFVYRGINPEWIDAECGTNSLNLGTSAQKPRDSYYMLKEAIRVQPIKTCVLDVSQDFYVESAYTGQSTSTYLVYDRMENSSIKTEYFFKAFDADDYAYGVCKACHYDFPSFGSFIENVRASFSSSAPEKLAYDNEWYESRGFVNSIQVYIGEDELSCQCEEIDENQLLWLGKIIELCEENNIHLFTVSSPKAQDYYAEKLNYAANVEKIRQYLAERGITYYDFKQDNMGNECFVDKVHLNGTGAEIYSKMIGELLRGNA